MPWAAGLARALLPAERQHRGADVARMQLQLAVLGIADLVRDAHAEGLAAPPPRRQVVTLGDHHVAAVAPAPVEVAAGGGAVAHRGHHLQETVADREQRVLEAVLAHTRIAMADLQAQHRAQLLHHRLEPAGHQADLPHADAVHAGRPASLAAIFRFSSSGVRRTMSSFWCEYTLKPSVSR